MTCTQCTPPFPQMRALDRVNVDFSTLEMALKKRLAEVTGLIEQEVCDPLCICG